MKGRVKWFNDNKGYGFITRDDNGNDLFAHYSQVEGNGHKSLEDGEAVEFEVEETDKGPRATSIKRLSTAV